MKFTLSVALYVVCFILLIFDLYYCTALPLPGVLLNGAVRLSVRPIIQERKIFFELKFKIITENRALVERSTSASHLHNARKRQGGDTRRMHNHRHSMAMHL